MKKVLFTSILLLSAVSFGGNIYAHDATGGNDKEVTTHSATQPSVTFTADGNTLTISGQGDLTSYTTTDWSAKVFTDKAVSNVFTGAYAAASVSANDSYNAANTYYRADYVYSLLESGIPSKSGYFTKINNVSTWKKTADISNLYAISYVNTTNGSHMIGMAKKVTSANTPNLANWSYGELANQAYYIISDEDIEDKQLDIETLNEKGYQTISLSDFSKKYVDVSATYEVWNSGVVFVKHANSESYESLQADKTYNYVDGDAFYTATVSFVKIDDNATFFAENAEYLKKDPKPFSVAQLTLSKIQQGAYENVVFKNESSAEPLLIDAAIIRSILYPNNGNANTALKNVDFGEATVNAFDELTFAPTDGYEYIPGHLNITKFTLPLTKKSSVYSENEKANVEKMVLPSKALGKMSGNTIQNVVIPEGYERLGKEAFDGCSHVKNFTFPKSLQVIGDRSFYYCNDLRKIEFNEGLENIGKEAFMGNSLVSVKFPSTLRIINDAAFATASKDPHITNIKLNAGLKYIGNSAFALENDESEGVLEIPASVRYIGPFAFNFRQYQDVYFYGETAPLMPLGLSSYKKEWGEGTGFSEHTLDGNSGFQPLAKSGLGDDINTGYANRENYKNGKAYFCIMHYPKSLSDKDRSTYTDIKRQYKTDPDKNQFHKDDVDGGLDGTKGADIVGQEQGEIKFGHCTAGKRVNWGYQDTYLGEQYIWPSQAQFTRAYATASNGLCWDGVTKYPADDDIESYLTKDDIATLEYAGYKIGTGKGEYSKADLAKLAHIGTRQFVLANADSNVDKDEEKEPEYNIVMKPGQWWTLCVPFNMTRKQVLDTFGADTQLYFFYQVERHTTDGKNSILLKFTKNALNYSSTNGEGNKMKGEDGKWLYEQMEPIVDDNEVVIWAHESYMIKPMNGQDSDKDATFVVKNYAPVVGNPLPTIVDATGTDQLQNDDYSKEYRFVGNYLGSTDNNKVVIPQYSYVYGKTTKDPTYKFRFYTGKTSVWKPNKSLVQSQDRQGGLRDYNNFFGADKSSTLPTSAKQASIFGEENFGETTGIDDVTIIAGNEVLTPIFTLDGKMVSANGSVDGLAKGVYVKAGKKFVVK